VFNPEIFQKVGHTHWMFLKQVAFDNLSFVTGAILNDFLFTGMWSSRPDLVNMGLKLGLFVLDPKNNFESTYL